MSLAAMDVYPSLTYRDLEAALEFLEKAFALEPERAEVLALAAISRVLAQAGLAIAHAQGGDAAPLASGAVPA